MNAAFAWVQRRRRWVFLAWALITIVGAALAPTVGGRLRSGFALSSPGYIANEALGAEFGGAGSNPSILLLDLPAYAPVTSPAGLRALTAVDASVSAEPGLRVISYATSPNATLIRDGGRATVVLVFPAQSGADAVDGAVMDRLAAAARVAVRERQPRSPGWSS